MKFAQLSQVKDRIKPGAPLPFNVRNADKTLLLARGQRVESQEHLNSLFERGALVDLAELLLPAAGTDTAVREAIKHASRAELPGLWSDTLAKVNQLLTQAPDAAFGDTLVQASGPVQALVERDPDLAIFQVLNHTADADQHYGAQRSVQTAIATLLIAQRLGWEGAQSERAFKVALTMNLSMLQLQGVLARQSTPLSDAQRADLHSHPARSRAMLEQAGISDADWLQAVTQHHEAEDGSGYPSGCTTVGELASLVRRADVYTAKLAARATRPALATDLASRQMFMHDPGHSMTTALVKEFGIYPPGCFVRLASGELALVVARGPTITTPVVACLTNERGAPLSVPVRRETGTKGCAVHSVVAAVDAPRKLSPTNILIAMAA
jgi:HD-GYP domain-containing protein (c-di-GMP phosphodiesterase class II)